MEVLGDPAAGGVVLVVDGVHVFVQDPDLVVKAVPDEVLQVKDGQGSQTLGQQLPDGRGHGWHLYGGRPHPLRHGDGQDEDELVPQSKHDGFPH